MLRCGEWKTAFLVQPASEVPFPLSTARQKWWMRDDLPMHPRLLDLPSPSPLLDTGVEMCGFGAAGERYNPDDAALYSLSPAVRPPTHCAVHTYSFRPGRFARSSLVPQWEEGCGMRALWEVPWADDMSPDWVEEMGNLYIRSEHQNMAMKRVGGSAVPWGRGQGRRRGKCYHEPLTLKQPGSLVRQPAEGRCCCCVSLLLFLLFIAFIEAMVSMFFSPLFILTIW